MNDTLWGADYASEDENYSDEQNAELQKLLQEAEEDYWNSDTDEDSNDDTEDEDSYDEESYP